MGRQQGTKCGRKARKTQGGESTTKAGKKRIAMTASEDTSSSESDSDSSCNIENVGTEDCTPEINRREKGTPIDNFVCEYAFGRKIN